MHQNTPLFERAYTCQICQMTFQSLSVRRSVINVEKRESDFRAIYHGVNPLHYSIIVCPVCKYAANKQLFTKELPSAMISQLAHALVKLETRNTEFTKERDLDTVLESFQLAIRTAQLKKSKPAELAGLIHAAAWICREANNIELEKAYLNQARKYYQQAYENSSSDIANLSEVQILYLIGELNLRTGEYAEAIIWFNKAISHADIKLNHTLEKQIREQWKTAHDLGQNSNSLQMHEKEKQAAAEVRQSKAESEQVNKTNPVSDRIRPNIQMMSNLYSDQIE